MPPIILEQHKSLKIAKQEYLDRHGKNDFEINFPKDSVMLDIIRFSYRVHACPYRTRANGFKVKLERYT